MPAGRWLLAAGCWLLVAGCARQPAAPTGPVAAAPSETAGPAAPAWAQADVEREGAFLAARSADAATADEAAAAAEAAARTALGQIRSVRVQALFQSATAEVAQGGARAVADRAVSASRTATDTIIAGALIAERLVQTLPGGRVRAWAQARIDASTLLPERRLLALMEQPPGPQRRAALVEEARRCLAGDEHRRSLAPWAARLAVADGGGAPELLLEARCLFDTGFLDLARDRLLACEQVIEGQPQAVFAAYEVLAAQVMASSLAAADLAQQVRALGRALGRSGVVAGTPRRLRDGWRIGFNVKGAPRRLVGLWADGDDLAPIAIPGAARPVAGAWDADFTWPGGAVPASGSIVVLALDPAHPALAEAAALPALSLHQPNADQALDAWRALFKRLALQPATAGFTIEFGR